MAFDIETCTAQHIGDRTEQQDRVALFAHHQQKGTLLVALADGMGGHSGGALAAEQVIMTAKHNFDAATPSGARVKELMAQSMRDAHEGIRLAALTSGQDPHSTACLLIVQPGRADWAHCGDSRIYHFRHGVRMARSFDHSYVMNLVKRGCLSEAQAKHHPQKNLLISCLGDKDEPQIEFGEAVPLVDGDCFLVCSDGLWAYFSDEELGRVLQEFPVRQAAEVLVNSARERAQGRGDNLSLAIVRLKRLEEEKPLPLWKQPLGK